MWLHTVFSMEHCLLLAKYMRAMTFLPPSPKYSSIGKCLKSRVKSPCLPFTSTFLDLMVIFTPFGTFRVSSVSKVFMFKLRWIENTGSNEWISIPWTQNAAVASPLLRNQLQFNRTSWIPSHVPNIASLQANSGEKNIQGYNSCKSLSFLKRFDVLTAPRSFLHSTHTLRCTKRLRLGRISRLFLGRWSHGGMRDGHHWKGLRGKMQSASQFILKLINYVPLIDIVN